MPKPAVPIDVNASTGVWETDGLPMLYVPRHFFINNHVELEQALGRDKYAGLLFNSGFQSAYSWCEHESTRHGLTGMEVFHHYMRRLSLRGWAQFDGLGIDETTYSGEVRVSHSCFVLHHGQAAGDKRCYAFAGWFAGALAWVSKSLGQEQHFVSFESQCAAQGNVNCLFKVTATGK